VGYNIRIGEALPVIYWDDRMARIQAADQDGVALGAPLNTSGDHSNFFYPGYLVWSEFTKQTGLFSVFYAPRCPNSTTFPCSRYKDDCPFCGGGRKSVWWVPEGQDPSQGQEGLIRSCGSSKLTEDHYTAFVTARQTWLDLPGEVRAGAVNAEDGRDMGLARLDFLVFWTRWALDNCEYPTFSS